MPTLKSSNLSITNSLELRSAEFSLTPSASLPELFAKNISILQSENMKTNHLNIPDLLKYILYINLDIRPDRLKHVQNEMNKLLVVGERVNAIKMPHGAVGCTLSHIKSLELAKERGWPHVFICEDDIFFLNPELLKENLLKFSENKEIDWDVVIIGGNNCPPYERIADYCIKVSNNQTTTGYIVKAHYYDTLLANFKESAKRLMREPTKHKQYALDIYWKSLQTTDKWYMITPPTVVQVDDYSDIEGRMVNYSGLMLDLDKEWLFKKQQLGKMW
jgi:GR25 family glycosyltransferase involved in LPS biosynthesis